MSTILDYYKYATLATAAYVRMGDQPPELRTDGATFAAAAAQQSDGRLPLVLAQYLFDPQPERPNPDFWRIKHYYGGDVPGVVDNTGFAATLFERGGEKVLAIRGTEPGSDRAVDLFQADLGAIGILGMSLPQAVSMINLIQRLKAGAGTTALQLRVQTSLTQPTGPFVRAAGEIPGSSVYISFSLFTAPGLGLIGANERVTVTGHSLGGHLAALAARLFPQNVNPDIYLFNAPGFDPLTINLAGNIPGSGSLVGSVLRTYLAATMGAAALNLATTANQLTNPLVQILGGFLATAALPDWTGFNLHNLESEDIAPGNDVSIVSSVLTGAQRLGPETFISTEANSHLIEPFLDGLALQALLYRLRNNTFTYNDITRLLEVSSNQLVRSEEQLTEALFRLLLEGQKFIDSQGNPTLDKLPLSDATSGLSGLFGIGKGDLTARAAFHDAVLRIGDAIKNKPGLQLFSLADIPAADLTGIAQGATALGYRYALRELNPFVILGDNAIYAPHNPKGELDLYVPATRTGTLTRDWIEDRAAFLAWKNAYFSADGQIVLRSDRNENFVFENRTDRGASDLMLTVVGNLAAGGDSGAAANPAKVMFGNAAPDVLSGGILSDRLYGDAGTDWIEGKAANDYLEGGAGLDVYNYNAFSGLLVSGNDGADVIRDTDGKGVIRYTLTQGGLVTNTATSTVIVDATVKLSDTQWQSADGRFTYTKIPNDQGRTDLLITINGDAGGSLTLKDWREGDFGIRLREARTTPQTASTILGDLEPRDFDPATPGVQTQTDALGNVIVSTKPEPDRDDRLFGDRPDTAVDPAAPGERIEAGGGHDVVFSDRPRGEADNGLGNADWVLAGAGRDVIESGAGNDLIEAGADGVLEGEAGGDVADGGAGDDELYAEAKIALADALRAGNDAAPTNLKGDLLSGASGEDWILGGRADDLLMGGAGTDTLIERAGNDALIGIEHDRTNIQFQSNPAQRVISIHQGA